MSRTITLVLGLLLSFSAFAQDLSLAGFESRFTLVKNDQGKVTAIRLKKAVARFTIMPFLQQIKSELLNEQASFMALTGADKEAEIDSMLYDMGMDPYAKDGNDEAVRIKESLMNIPNINVKDAWAKLEQTPFWQMFEAKLQEAFLFIDPRVLANLEDPRFFYKKQVTYKVVVWALQEAAKYFNEIPLLNIASFVIVRVHDMMLEQRYFHHNMLLHYFETIPETKLGMTKEEVDRAVSSIYEYRIAPTGLLESNKAAADWLNYGMNNFYMQVRAGNTRMRTWESGFGPIQVSEMKKLDFAFVEATEAGARKIFHLHVNAHEFSQKPALAYDYSNPSRVKRNRALLNLAGVALGFIPKIPDFIRSQVQLFIQSFYVQQVRMEGALVGYFESTGDQKMINYVYAQRANFYIVQ